MLLIDPLTCLVAAIYFEARGETPLHQAMVAETIFNRVESRRYPNTICGVVKQKDQFTFYWDGKPERVRDNKAWRQSVIMANHVINNRPKMTKACHYATYKINNYWTVAYKGQRHGTHIFYEGGC